MKINLKAGSIWCQFFLTYGLQFDYNSRYES